MSENCQCGQNCMCDTCNCEKKYKVTDYCNSIGEDICVYHYTDCDDNSDESLKKMRGVIKQGDNVLCNSFKYTLELFSDEKEKIIEKLEPIFDKCKFYEAKEGTLIRVWNLNGRWQISTHKKLNAYDSYWGCNTSHGELFENGIIRLVKQGQLKIDYNREDEILTKYLEALDNSKVYTFLVATTEENRIVSRNYDSEPIYFSGEFIKQENEFILTDQNTSMIQRPREFKWSSIDNLIDYIDSCDTYLTQGIMLYLNENTPDFCTIKLTCSYYRELASIRGNCSSLERRFFELFSDKTELKRLYNLYPEHKELFRYCKQKVTDLKEEIFTSYKTRFIYNKYIMMPKQVWYHVKYLHQLYLEDKEKYRISRKLVREYVDNLSPKKLFYLAFRD